MGNQYTQRELAVAVDLDGQNLKANAANMAELRKGKHAADAILKLAKAENSPITDYNNSYKFSLASKSIVCAALISVNAYKGVLESLGVSLSEKEKENFYDSQIKTLSQEYGINYAVVKRLFDFSEELSKSKFFPNSENFDKLLFAFDKDFKKDELSSALLKIVNAPNFKKNISYASTDIKKRSKYNIVVSELDKKIPLPIFNEKIDFLLIDRMLSKKNVWFNPGLGNEVKADIFMVMFRFIFISMAVPVCQSILSIDKDYKELIIEKLNKTRCTMDDSGGLHDYSIKGNISTSNHMYSAKIKITATSGVLNDYIEMYNMFNDDSLNLKKGINLDNLVLKLAKESFNTMTDKNLISLCKLLKINEDYILDVLKHKDGIHIFEIFKDIANKLSNIKDHEIKGIDLIAVYDLVFNTNPNNLLYYAEAKVKKSVISSLKMK